MRFFLNLITREATMELRLKLEGSEEARFPQGRLRPGDLLTAHTCGWSTATDGLHKLRRLCMCPNVQQNATQPGQTSIYEVRRYVEVANIDGESRVHSGNE